ncbi:MAG: hypothetical protein MJ252_02735 [archaeon]|nr:hypothetical protein [archaeon]
MIDKTPIPGLDINSDVAKTQINNFWNYLDDLAANNPEEYKKFINAQFKKGIEMYGNDKNKKETNESHIENINLMTKRNFEVKTYLCLRLKILKIFKELEIEEDKSKKDEISITEKCNKNEISEVPDMTFSYEFDSDAFSSKVIQNRKIYLNIVYSDDYYLPTDKEGNFLKGNDLEDDNKWSYIPTEFRYNGKKDSFSGSRCDFYDMIISQFIIDKISKDKKLFKAVLNYIIRKFILFLSDKVILYTKSIKMLREKKYKSVKGLPPVFASKLGERNILRQRKEKENKSFTPLINEIGKSNTVKENTIKEDQKKDNPINPKNEITIRSMNSSDDNNEIREHIKIKPNESEDKKIKIEELASEDKLTIPIKKQILNKNQMEVKFFFDEFDHLNGLSEIDLQISENGISIKILNNYYIENKNYEPINMVFNYKVDPEKCTAKYKKKDKILTVIIYKVD